MIYQVLIEEQSLKFLLSLPEKSQRTAKERCRALADDPFPGKGGDKEALHFPGFRKLYRLHIGRSYTVLYRIFAEEKILRIFAITAIEQAHKMYVAFMRYSAYVP